MKINESINKKLSQSRFILDLMWYSLLGGLVIYGLVLVNIENLSFSFESKFTEFDFIAVAMVISFFIVAMIIQKQMFNIDFAYKQIKGNIADIDSHKESLVFEAIRYYQSRKFIQWGMLEMITIMGLVVSYLSKNIVPYAICFLMTFFLMLLFKSKIDDFIEKFFKKINM